jgi:hypothetical protein
MFHVKQRGARGVDSGNWRGAWPAHAAAADFPHVMISNYYLAPEVLRWCHDKAGIHDAVGYRNRPRLGRRAGAARQPMRTHSVSRETSPSMPEFPILHTDPWSEFTPPK